MTVYRSGHALPKFTDRVAILITVAKPVGQPLCSRMRFPESVLQCTSTLLIYTLHDDPSPDLQVGLMRSSAQSLSRDTSTCQRRWYTIPTRHARSSLAGAQPSRLLSLQRHSHAGLADVDAAPVPGRGGAPQLHVLLRQRALVWRRHPQPHQVAPPLQLLRIVTRMILAGHERTYPESRALCHGYAALRRPAFEVCHNAHTHCCLCSPSAAQSQEMPPPDFHSYEAMTLNSCPVIVGSGLTGWSTKAERVWICV